MDKDDSSWLVPEDIQDKLAKIAAQFEIDTNIGYDRINKFMQDIIAISLEYFERIANETLN